MKIRAIKSRDFDAFCNINKGLRHLDKDKLKAEIERIENIKRNKASKFIHDELNQYLKLLKRQLKQAKNE